MDDSVSERLLLSVKDNRLVILCGAGLSMAPPTNLPSAERLAAICSEEYRRSTGLQLPAGVENNLERMAEHFRQNAQFHNVFIENLIPWKDFTRNPNLGHYAMADFLVSGIAEYGVTTNLDTLIEVAAYHLGETDLRATVKRNDIYLANLRHNRLIKLHGCCRIDRSNTIWCVSQINEDPVRLRIENFRAWMDINLRERDMLIIGFWSDWAYLNSIFENCISDVEPRAVILVDPSDSASLQTKAQDLWDWAHGGGVAFFHVRESGADFLDELRGLVSKIWLENQIDRSRDNYERLVGVAYNQETALDKSLSTEDLYTLRQNFCGVPKFTVPQYFRNLDQPPLIGAVHLILLANGAQLSGACYTWQGKQVRLVEASGRLMSKIKEEFSEEPPVQADVTVCVGAIDDGAQVNIVRVGIKGSILRNNPTQDWETSENFLQKLTGGQP